MEPLAWYLIGFGAIALIASWLLIGEVFSSLFFMAILFPFKKARTYLYKDAKGMGIWGIGLFLAGLLSLVVGIYNLF